MIAVPSIRLTDQQTNSLIVAARQIPGRQARRLVDVAEQLAGKSEIGDGDVNRAIRTSAKKFFGPPTVASEYPATRNSVRTKGHIWG